MQPSNKIGDSSIAIKEACQRELSALKIKENRLRRSIAEAHKLQTGNMSCSLFYVLGRC